MTASTDIGRLGSADAVIAMDAAAGEATTDCLVGALEQGAGIVLSNKAPLALPATEGVTRTLTFSAIVASPAVQLLLERARAIDPALEITGSNADTIATICARLDGLPLAIELAAVRLGKARRPLSVKN